MNGSSSGRLSSYSSILSIGIGIVIHVRALIHHEGTKDTKNAEVTAFWSFV
jgi:hypothetical protein